MTKEFKYYNLTAHFCHHEEVETDARIPLNLPMTSHDEMREIVIGIASLIPRESEVVIGGHPQIISLMLQLAKIKQWKVHFYSTYDSRVYPCTFLTRNDRMEVEKYE